MKRVFYLIIDQLAGHWEESVKIEGTSLPPVNVKGYHEMGLIPNLSYLIENGLWVRRPWNRGDCNTRSGMRYLATGRYAPPLYGKDYWDSRNAYTSEDLEGFFEYAKMYLGGEFRCLVFSSWFQRGYFYTPDMIVNPYSERRIDLGNTLLWPDLKLWRNFIRPYLDDFPDFNLVHVYFPTFDFVCGCPSYLKENFHPLSSKHAYMLFLDELIGEIIGYLQAKKLWDETYFVIASDHGYHLGCTVAKQMGAKTNNWCCGHQPPWDCEVWDFQNDRSTGIYSGGPRRITFILSGGGLEEEYRGKFIEEAEIIDVIPTIAHILDIPYKCEGRSILKLKPRDQKELRQ